MEIILSIDGGGSKLSAVLFDSKFQLLGRGISSGVNTNHTSLEDSRTNVVNCLNQVFSGKSKIHIDRLYVVFVGPVRILYEELAKYATVGERVILGEARAGLLASAMRKEGILALAGTGSDVFYLRNEPALNSLVGAWGPILGDQGSGTWIGQKALQAVVAAFEGWGKQTMIYELIRREWKLKTKTDLIHIIHKSIAPFRTVASVTPLVGKAACAGDSVALQILRDAGLFMAIQTDCLISRQNIPEEYRYVVCCGGAWKAHPAMFTSFYEQLQKLYPGIHVEKPWFEHVMAGPVSEIIRKQIPVEEAKKILSVQFPDYVIKW